jgi:hypothetical protein
VAFTWLSKDAIGFGVVEEDEDEEGARVEVELVDVVLFAFPILLLK